MISITEAKIFKYFIKYRNLFILFSYFITYFNKLVNSNVIED